MCASTRARVSSQCWKRQVRLELHNLGAELGSRTKLIKSLIEKECIAQGASNELAFKCGSKIEQVFIGKEEKAKKLTEENEESSADSEENENQDKKTDTLLFLSPSEVKKLVEAFKNNKFDADKTIIAKKEKQAKEISEILGDKLNYSIDGLDIALFGRMVAKAPSMDVEAASSFSHAISTHKISNAIDYFTALDDLKTEPGSAHIGFHEFNSATYYRYVSLNIGKLYENLNGQNILESIEKFIKALYIAIPTACQTTKSGASPWEFAKIFVRKGQCLQVPFETAIKQHDGGFLESSKQTLIEYLDKKEKLSGSLFGKISDFTFGDDEKFNIDILCEKIKKDIEKNL